MIKVTEGTLALIEKMFNLALQANHDQVWTFDGQFFFYLSWDKKKSQAAVDALKEADCLCDEVLGTIETTTFTKDV
jgi:hypothetical protein